MKLLIRLSLVLAVLTLISSCKKSKQRINEQPDNNGSAIIAYFNWSGVQRVNSNIKFTNASKNADTYKWDFGNGQTSAKHTPDDVKFTAAGAYTITLVAGKGNNKAVYQQTIAIAGNEMPASYFSYTFKDQRNYAPATVLFKNESVNADFYKWQINGNTYNSTDLQHTFNQAGDYIVKLTAIKGQDENTFTDTITVAPNNNPIARFALPYHPYPYTVNEPIQLVNQSTNADSWEWTFSNGAPASSTAEHPEVKFGAPGVYTITLIAKKGSLKSAPRSINIKIN